MRIIILTLIFMVSMHNAVSLDKEATKVDFDETAIFVGGSTSVSGLFIQVKEKFEARSKYQFQLRQLGSDKGILAVHNGIIDIGFSSRYLTTEEQKKYPNLKQYIIAHDAVALFVNKNNSWIFHDNTTFGFSFVNIISTLSTSTTSCLPDPNNI